MPVLFDVLDGNSKDSIGNELALNGETVITVYVLNISGSSDAHSVVLQASPDSHGDTWMDVGVPLVGQETATFVLSAARVRAYIVDAETIPSTIRVAISAS